MKRTRIAAFALASALLALPAGAEWVDSEWWNVDFTDQTPGDYHQVPNPSGEGTLEYGGVVFEQGTLNGVTNKSRQVNAQWVSHQPYASGLWKADPADESYITNGIVTNAVGDVWDLENYLELSTQGNEITWQPTNATPGLVNLVDARMRLVGSDSAPEISDFDPTGATHRVQAAIYLKNETDADTGEVTNSVLCVYAWDSSLNGGNGANTWMDLKAKNNDLVIEDGTWHRVQVSIDYTDEINPPTVTVKVDEKEMIPVSGAAEITAANYGRAKAAGKVQEVCFRGTGAIDNFVGKTMLEIEKKLWFETKIYLDGNPMTEEDFDDLYWDWVAYNEAKVGDVGGEPTAAEFSGIWATDTDISYGTASDEPSWCLDKVVLHRFGTPGGTDTYVYHWNESTFQIDSDPGNEETTEIKFSDDGFGTQDGFLSLHPLTNGANDPTNLIAEVYLKHIGLFTVYGETYVDGAVVDIREQKYDHNSKDDSIELGDTDTLRFPTSFTTNGTTYVLTRIPTNANEAVSAPMVNIDGTEVQVNVALYGLSDDVVVNAYYEEGTLDGKVVMRNPTEMTGAYTFFGAVAMIDGDPEPAYFPTLQGAIDKCLEGQTVTMIADVRTTSETAITNTVVLDLNGFTITAGNTNARRFKVYENGDLTLTNSVPETGAIVSDEFLLSNTGCCLIRVDGTFTMNGGAVVDTVTIPVDVDNDGEDDDAYVANAVAAFGTAVVTINDGSITASGYAISLNGSAAGENYSNGASITINGGAITATMGTAVYVPAGSVTVNGGTLTGLDGVYAKGGRLVFPADSTAVVVATAAADEIYGWEAMNGGSNLTGDALTLDNSNYTYGPTLATIAGGTFVSSNAHAVACYAVEGATMGSKFVTGGWFSDQVAADYVADGYQCVQDADNAPNADATYTVKAAAVQLWDAETEANVGSAQLSIADAVSVAVDNGVDVSNRVFVIIRPLAAETYLIASTNELFTIQTTNTEYVLNLTVDTSLESTDALVYTMVGPMTVTDAMVDPPVSTISWHVKANAYVAKVVNEDTTVDRYASFEMAADRAVGDGLTVVMVADELAETYTLEDGETLSVMENGFLVPEVMPETDAYYIVETVDGGITTYTSTNYLLAVFYNNDGVPFSTNRVEHGTAPVTPRIPAAAIVTPGYDSYFNGWSPDATLPIDADTDYTATYVETAHVYTITYQLGGQNNAFAGAAWPEGYVETNSYTVLDPDLVLPSPVLDGYAFKGWYTNGYDVPPPVDPGVVPHGSIGDYTFEAVWNEMVAVHFLDGATEVTNFQAEAGADFAAPAPDPAKVNPVAGWDYTFEGWAAAPGSTVAVEWPQSSDVEVWYYAIWTSNATPYSITLDPDGGAFDALVGWFADGDVYTNSFTVESEAFPLPEPTKANYDFVGWVRTDLVGAQPAKPVEIAQGTHENRAYRASWTPTVYEIELVLDGGDLPDGVFNPIEYTVESQTFTLPEPYKDGFDFVGWTEDGTSTNLTVTIEQGSSGDRTFTAVWEDAAPPEVDAGEKLAEYQAAHPDAEVPPAIAFDADEKCGVSFVAPAKGWYVLMTNDMVNGTYAADVGSKVEVTDANVETPITLTESSSGTTKFFKIGWSKTEPSGE